MKTLKEMIDEAIANGACSETVEKLNQYKTLEEALKNENAPFWCYWYAKRVLKGRWPEIEYKILESSIVSYWYAVDIIDARWPEAEKMLKGDGYYWRTYTKVFGIEE